MANSSGIHELDVMEDDILNYDCALLKLLLQDKSSRKNIIWATTGYEAHGKGYEEFSEILPEQITGEKTLLIQPRSAKDRAIQEERTRTKAEVFTPSWVCNQQNNLVDAQWFGKTGVFNVEIVSSWKANPEKIPFPKKGKTWKRYVDARRLEVSCGEGPYMVSRYDTVTGDLIPIPERIGLFDRKMRVVSENAEDPAEWMKWSIRAVESVYGYEYQGDNLLLARENMLFSYVDYYRDYFGKAPDHGLLKKVANIIAWNLWQMDGMKYVVPGSCHAEETGQLGLIVFIEKCKKEPCPGCKYNDPYSHNGIYCKIKDWRAKSTVRFIDMMKGGKT